MRTSLLAMILLLAVSAQPQEPAEGLYIVLFSLGPEWKADKPPNEQAGFKEHSANMKRLRDAGRIAVGARYSDKGMIILRAASQSDASAEIAADPGVKAGIFTFETFELKTFYKGCIE